MDETDGFELWKDFNEEDNNSAEKLPSSPDYPPYPPYWPSLTPPPPRLPVGMQGIPYFPCWPPMIPPPPVGMQGIPSSRWLSPSIALSESDEISPEMFYNHSNASLPSNASLFYASERRSRQTRLLGSFVQQDVDFFPEIHKLGLSRFTYEDIICATNNFNYRNIIERGSCTKTYKGKLPRKIFAVKLFGKGPFWDAFRKEMYVSSRLRHRNITGFLGYCIKSDKYMLIYEYEQNGSLDRLLFGEQKGEKLLNWNTRYFRQLGGEEKLLNWNTRYFCQLGGEQEGEKLLNWNTRYKICLGIANGLAYLHKERIIHTNIKPSRILLDADFVPKIEDFSLAKCMSEYMTKLTTRTVGTILSSYMDPEDLRTGKYTEKTDVFSYGVVILEIVSGTRACEAKRSIELEGISYSNRWHDTLVEQVYLLEFVDPRLGLTYSEEEALTLLKLSALCTQNPSSLRPSISTVVSILEGKLKVEELIYKQRQNDYELDYPSVMGEETDHGTRFLKHLGLRNKEESYFHDMQHIRRFEFREVTLATSYFAHRIQGCANVFLGFLEDCHQNIAVKRFLTSSESLLDELKSEIYAFSGLGHPNITRILGFCREGQEYMLIYEFMQKSTLAYFLRPYAEQGILNMTITYKICLGIAKGLAYLHNNFIHGDIKPVNILLDEDFSPKIMNLSPTKHMREDMIYVTTKGVGSFGYLDPEYLHSGKFTKEGDVYSYGVVILQLVSRKRFFEVNVCQLHECLDKHGKLLQFVDPQLIDSDDSREKALMLLKLSVLCTKPQPELRPLITKVVSMLEGDVNDMEPSKEKVIEENPTTEICSHEAFEKLRALVLSNSLEEALKEKIKIEIFHLCEILDGSTFLPEARSGLAHRVKDFLVFTSQLSIVCKEDSSYDEDSQLASLDEKKMELLNLQNPVASDSNDIIRLAKSLMESRKVALKRRLIHSKKCIDKGKEDWKFIQTRFKGVGVLEGEINIKELNKEKLMQSDVDGDGCDPTNPDTEPDKLISSSISLLQKMQQQMISCEEDSSHEEETLPLPDNEALKN